MLEPEVVQKIATRLGAAEYITVEQNKLSNEARLKLKEDEKFEKVICQILFNCDEFSEISEDKRNLFNAYRHHFTGIGDSRFYLNEAFEQKQLTHQLVFWNIQHSFLQQFRLYILHYQTL